MHWYYLAPMAAIAVVGAVWLRLHQANKFMRDVAGRED
jgi:hypothetical protein